MNWTHHIRERAERLHEPGATRFLLLLLAADIGFLALDGIATFTDLFADDMLSITRDQGYPEAFQYMKFVWLVGLTSAVAWRDGAPRYLAWVLLFAFLGLDDALQIHETLGEHLVGVLGLAPAGNLRAQDFGELIVAAGAGLFLIGLVALAIVRSSAAFRRASLDLFALLLLLVFFGVVLDIAAMAVDLGPALNRFPAAAEDWGEMVTVSLMTWYAFRMVGRRPEERLASGGLVGRAP